MGAGWFSVVGLGEAGVSVAGRCEAGPGSESPATDEPVLVELLGPVNESPLVLSDGWIMSDEIMNSGPLSPPAESNGESSTVDSLSPPATQGACQFKTVEALEDVFKEAQAAAGLRVIQTPEGPVKSAAPPFARPNR